MPLSPIFIRRSIRDTNRITNISLRAATRVGGKIRARLIESMGSGQKFHIAPYLIQQLRGILTTTMLASHLSGYRRAFLILKQTPGLTRRLQQGTLKLSELSDALGVLQKRINLNIDALQEKYDTQALKILNNVSGDIEEALNAEFQDLIESGAHVSEAVERLGKKFDELGLSPREPYQLETIFRTQLQLAFNAGRYQAEQAPEIQEILWGYKYVTVGDDRVRDEHAALEGTTLPKDDAFWQRFYPPNGWNCRCQVIPLFEEREISKPPKFDSDGNAIEPDKGFDFNPGNVFK